MPRSAKPKHSSPERRDGTQSERFKQTARELGVDIDEDKLKETLRRMKRPERDDEKDGDGPPE